MSGGREQVICMAMDAFRLCIGLPLRNFTPEEIVAFVRASALTARAA